MDWKTWSPFQSSQTQEICAHMTPQEKSETARRGAWYGVWCALTLAIPLSQILVAHPYFPVYMALILMIIHLACIPIWQSWQRRFLCATQWAKQQEIQPNALKLFCFRSIFRRIDKGELGGME